MNHLKTHPLNIIFFLAIIILSSCGEDNVFGVKGQGPVVQETRSFSSFDRIEMGMSGELFITQGPDQHVVIEAQRNILDVIQSDEKNGKLEIDFKRGYNLRNHSPIKVYITVPTLTDLDVSGSAKAYAEGPFETNDIVLSVSGSGKIDIKDLKVQRVYSYISGSGNLYLGGTAEESRIDISGSGKIEAFPLYTLHTEAKISGSGRCEVTVEKTLKASISGSGRIHYKGNPTIDFKASGSGKVINAN